MGRYFRSCWKEKKRKLDLTKNELDSFKYCLNVMGRNLRLLDLDTLHGLVKIIENPQHK